MCALLCPQTFLKVMPWRAKNRDSALRLAEIRRLRRIETKPRSGLPVDGTIHNAFFDGSNWA